MPLWKLPGCGFSSEAVGPALTDSASNAVAATPAMAKFCCDCCQIRVVAFPLTGKS